MPSNPTADTAAVEIPADVGLPTGGKPGDDPRDQRPVSDALEAAANGGGLTPEEGDDLVAYFLSNAELPGDSEPHPLTVTLGHGAKKRTFSCVVHPIEWSEWQDARQRATNEKTGEFDAYVSSSWTVARALVTPRLGPVVQRQQREAQESEDGKIAGPKGERIDPPADAAHMLRRMFVKQSGSLLGLSGKVLEISHLQNDDSSVREVEAAKN